MRFRELELARYGGFANRSLVLGNGVPDLHLIVGPNEAGKSTTLQAIGDFLFGIGGQTTQGWRWDYRDLRIRAVVEDGGRTLEVVRRKGNKDTLLAADGTPLVQDTLTPLLGGVDRAAFERMFGLDHARLREGGDAILRGRDDAARITLEAGTGVAGIGREMDRFAAVAADLFKAGGSVPVINRLLRERGDAQKLVRESAINETQWAEEKRRREDAERRRAALIDEAAALGRETARLDRIGRARAPLARLAAARVALDELGPTPDLPPDAVDRLSRALGELRTAGEFEAGLRADLHRLDEEATRITVPDELLALADRIEALDERRPVIEKANGDVGRREAERDRLDERIASARAEARLPPDAPIPGAGWRRRANAHLQDRREAAVAARSAAKRRIELDETVKTLQREIDALGPVRAAQAIHAALDNAPADAAARLARSTAEVTRKRERAEEEIRGLAPWAGDASALASMDIPGAHAASATAGALEAARTDALSARREADARESEAVAAEGRMAALFAAGELPTADAVADARAARDVLVGELLGGGPVDGPILRNAISGADALADRRHAEAERIAEHAGASAASATARALEMAARARAAARDGETRRIEEAWSADLHKVGFIRAVAPADLAAWILRRAQALDAVRETRDAVEALGALRAAAEASDSKIATALREASLEPPADPASLIPTARAQARLLTDAAARREQLVTALESARNLSATAGRARSDEQADAAAREAVLEGLLREAGLAVDGGETALHDAMAAIEVVTDEAGGRAALDRQISGMRSDARAYQLELETLLTALARTNAEPPTLAAARLAAELRQAKVARDRLEVLAAERLRLEVELDTAVRRGEAAARELQDLRARAGADDEPALERAVATAGQRAALRAAEAEAEAELRVLDGGEGLAALSAEAVATPPDDEAVARAACDERRTTLAAEREEVGRALNAADEALGRAARDSAAADAQQVVADTSAALASAAETHLEATAAAAMLRWVLERHRQTNQAPLIARAGSLFAAVTDGAFTGLAVDYDEGDRPSVRALRSVGGAVGVDALSEGTRDQLYLALRLGSIEAGAHALPIVCDDLLVTADDSRAGAMLRVLAAAAQRNQVLLFTHHDHLVEIARQAIGPEGFVLHRLAPADLAAA